MDKDTLTIALAQANPVVGDIAGNAEKIRVLVREAAGAGAGLVVFSELFLCGYPPEDLILRPAFMEDVRRHAARLAEESADWNCAALIGAPYEEGGRIYNAALLIDDGRIAGIAKKTHLPNYDIFDEKRLFVSATDTAPLEWRGHKLGVLICEDMWATDVAETLKAQSAQCLLVLNGSPFDVHQHDARLSHARACVKATALPLVYVNQVGGQDEIVFDGASFVMGADGKPLRRAPAFDEALLVSRWEAWRLTDTPDAAPKDENDMAMLWRALVLGVRDYVEKNGFPGVVIGLSGGIDSAVVAALAVDALGAKRVHCVMLPSRYTSKESFEAAAACASLLHVRSDEIAIDAIVSAGEEALKPLFGNRAPDATEENIQARVRGLLLMALSNKLGSMLLTTGNKSEMSVGYATLYGDMNGGFNPLKDIYKTDVYALAGFRNKEKRVIPEIILTRAPSAELRANQTDQDSLPPYEDLDAILRALIDDEMSLDALIAKGHDRALVHRIDALVRGAEYKRRQAPPGVRVSRRAFGRARRYPITNRFIHDGSA